MPAGDHPVSAIPWPDAISWSLQELRLYLAAAADPAVQALPTRCPPWLVAGRADELIGHQRGPIPVGLQVMFGLNELAVHHDDLAHAAGSSYRPCGDVIAALATMYRAVHGMPAGPDPWACLLQATGR